MGWPGIEEKTANHILKFPPYRNLAAGPNKTDDQGIVPQQLLFDKNFSTSTTVQNVLPYIGVSDSGHAEDRFPTRLMDTPNR